MDEHISLDERIRYRSRTLDRARLLEVDEHLAACSSCRESTDSEQVIDAFLGNETHPPYEALEAFVDGGGDRDARRHVASCAQCAREVEDLRQFAEGFQKRSWWPAAASVAAMLAASAWFVAHQPVRIEQVFVERPRLAIRDGNGVIAIANDGKLRGAPAGLETLIASVLSSGRLSQQSSPLRIEYADALRGESTKSDFRLRAPLFEVVVEATPRFEWTPAAPDASYVVEVFDARFHRVARSPSLRQATWTPEHSLPRGVELRWQVTALSGAHRTIAPLPPDPPARFRIIDDATAQEIARAGAAQSHLALAALYARAGVRDRSENELHLLEQLNPHSEFVKRLHETAPVN